MEKRLLEKIKDHRPLVFHTHHLVGEVPIDLAEKLSIALILYICEDSMRPGAVGGVDLASSSDALGSGFDPHSV